MNRQIRELGSENGELLSSEYFGTSEAWSVHEETLTEGVEQGVRLIHVHNEAFKWTIIPTRGMSLLRMGTDEISLGWNSPIKKVVHPQFISLHDHGGLGWLAGFNEMMVRCGVAFAGHPGLDQGTFLTLHGRVGNLAADQVSVSFDPDENRISVRGRIEEKSFKFCNFELWTETSMVLGSKQVRVRDRLVNLSEYDQEYQIIYHSNFGPPLLGEGARFVAPIKSLAPLDDYAARDLETYDTYLGPTKNYGEQVYCATLHSDKADKTVAMLRNAKGTCGVAMRYGTTALPYFTLWKNTDTETDGYVTGLEPGTGFPYNRSVERSAGRLPKLAAKAEVEFELEYSLLDETGQVDAVAQEIEQQQTVGEPEISSTPPRPQPMD